MTPIFLIHRNPGGFCMTIASARHLATAASLLAATAGLGLVASVGSAAVGQTAAPAAPAPPAWTSITPGASGQTCGVRVSGTLWCWGYNGEGQLGDGTTTDHLTPVQVGAADNWATVSPGGSHTCATRVDGSAWCWGLNTQGELGDGTSQQRLSPVQVGNADDWTALQAGSSHTCGLRGDGVAWCWGANDFGKLGNGTHGRKHAEKPVRVQTKLRFTSLEVGDEHTCAISVSGAAWCWGSNFNGQLGIGSQGRDKSRDVPTQVGEDSDWTALRGGYETTCGIRGGGTAWCWGDNSSGQLGDGTTITRTVPTHVGASARWSDVQPGGSHACGVHLDGTAWCWGSNGHGQLGDGSKAAHRSPTRVGSARNWVSASAGGSTYVNHSCGVRSTGAAWCWGENAHGQVGDGSTTDRLTPVLVFAG